MNNEQWTKIIDQLIMNDEKWTRIDEETMKDEY